MTQVIHSLELVEREADIKFKVPLRDLIAHFPNRVVSNPEALFADMVHSRMKAMGDNKRVALMAHSDTLFDLCITVQAWVEDK